MFQILFRYVIPVVSLLVLSILTYNYFLGTPDEKKQAREMFGKVRSLMTDVVKLISSEKEKFDQGKYDEAIKKMQNAINRIKQHASRMARGGQEIVNKLQDLEAEKAEVERKIAEIKEVEERLPPGARGAVGGTNPERLEELRSRMEDLARHTDELADHINER